MPTDGFGNGHIALQMPADWSGNTHFLQRIVADRFGNGNFHLVMPVDGFGSINVRQAYRQTERGRPRMEAASLFVGREKRIIFCYANANQFNDSMVGRTGFAVGRWIVL
jgi:hypothetical protein